jgi:hypothetical protein
MASENIYKNELLQCQDCNSLNIKRVRENEIENEIPERYTEEAYDVMGQTDLDYIYYCFDCHTVHAFFSTGTELGPHTFKAHFHFETTLKEKNQLIKEPWVQKNHLEDLSDTWQKACLKYIVTGSLRAPRTSP